MGDGRPLLHALGVAAENLGGGGGFILSHLKQRDGLLVLIAQGLGTDHLRAGETCPLLPTDGAKRHIRYTCHRPQGQGCFNLNSSNGYHEDLLNGQNLPRS